MVNFTRVRQSLARLSGWLLCRSIDEGLQPPAETGSAAAGPAGAGAGGGEEAGPRVVETPIFTNGLRHPDVQILIYGGRGSGKTTIAQQIAAALLNSGQRVRYRGRGYAEQRKFAERVEWDRKRFPQITFDPEAFSVEQLFEIQELD